MVPVTTKKPRSKLGARDMVLSMGLVAIIVGISLVFMWKPAPDPIRVINYRDVITSARDVAPYEVLAPENLPASWRATSGDIAPQADGSTEWRLGFVSPAQQYVGYIQRGPWAPAAQKAHDIWLRDLTRNGVPDTVPTWKHEGKVWQRLNGDPEPDAKRALVYRDNGVTTVVHGSADWSELEAMVAKLG